MNEDERKLLVSLATTANSLAVSLVEVQAELNAHRVLLVAALRVLEEQPEQLIQFGRAVQAAAEGDEIAALNTPVPDVALQRRKVWLKQLLPVSLKPIVRLH